MTIANYQPAPRGGFAEINSRVWQINVYDRVFFNDYVKAILERDIFGKVIMNGMTGSSWGFKRIGRLCITVNCDQYRGIGN